jgi:hypothetical protein
MILAGHQPNYLPYLGFFHKVAQADILAIVDNVQFVKRGTFGWMNRNRIRTKDGWMWLTVPVLTKGKYHQLIIDTKINNDLPWGKKHFNAIYHNYHRTPYLKKYIGFFEDIYKRHWDNFCGLSTDIIKYIIKELGINIKIIMCSEIGVEGKATEYVIDMCKKLKADTYLSGVHGKDYLDESLFLKENIKLGYQEFVHPKYPQQYEEFIPELSIIDLLFNCGPDSLDILLDRRAGLTINAEA